MKNIRISYKWISLILAVGIPQLLYEIVKECSGLTGAMAITHTLKYLGFNIHMEVGVKTLIITGVLSFILSEWLLVKYYKHKLERDIVKRKANTVLKVLCLIETYNIPVSLKKVLKTYFL
ncbi:MULTISPECIES: hypothetical protein [Aquimarina]|uniref:hypothetical protein n=1 Tax=Aquimarina TaxID=290174 RepID=UPI000CDE7D99|nr:MULTISPECIES: hypothetical protein [Aquimarina]